MISNKFFMMTMCVLAVTSAALNVGCVTEDEMAQQQTFNLDATIYDVDGSAMANTGFDYYIDMVTFGGGQMGYYAPGKTTDSSGNWSKTESDLTFVAEDGYRCANVCVSWENFSCNAYATDCWNTDYSDTANIYSIDPTQISTSVGLETSNGGYRVYGGTEFGSYLMDSPQAYLQKNKFDTDLTLVSSEGATSLQLAGRPNTSAGANVKYNIYRASKPVIIQDLAKLTKKQAEKFMHYRAVSKLPDAAFKVEAALVGSESK